VSSTRETLNLDRLAALFADAEFKIRPTRSAIRALMRWAEVCESLGHDIERYVDDGGIYGVILRAKPGWHPPIPQTCMDALVNKFDHEETPIP